MEGGHAGSESRSGLQQLILESGRPSSLPGGRWVANGWKETHSERMPSGCGQVNSWPNRSNANGSLAIAILIKQGITMKKPLIIMLCLSSFLLQGCWTTQTKDNPKYADCSSYHNSGYEAKQEANHVTVVSATVGRCYRAEGAKLAQARGSAMEKCKSSGNQDCAVFAENKKIVLSPTIKDRDMDWGSTLALVSAGLMAGAVYEAGKTTGSSGSGYVPPQTYVPPAQVPSVGRLPPEAKNSVPPPPGSGAAVTPISGSGGQAKVQVPNLKRCVQYKHIKSDGNTIWFRLTNTCGESISVHWCDSTGADTCPSGPSYLTLLSPGRHHESWYSANRYRGISYFACPQVYMGRPVNSGNGYCYVAN